MRIFNLTALNLIKNFKKKIMKKITLFVVLVVSTILVVNTIYSQILPTPIAAYKFEDDASDEMGNYDGTLVNDAKIVNDVQRGGNVLSLIDSGYVTIPIELAAELDNFSFTAWVNYGGDVPWAGLMGLGMFAKNVAPYWDFHIQGPEGEGRGKLSFYASAVLVWPGDGTAQTVVGDYRLPIEEWTHLALTFELGTGGAVYADGELLELEPWNSSNDHDVSPSILGAEIFTIGRDAYNQGTLTHTKIDDFRFYDVAITPEDVAAIYAGLEPSSIGKNITHDNDVVQIYPNPFKTETTIKFHIPESRNVKLSVNNVFGQEIAVIVDDFRNAGTYSLSFDGSGLQSGVYFIRFESNGHSTFERVLLLK